jgi:hypothetical protein
MAAVEVKKVVRVFPVTFMLTKSNIDPAETDYTLNTFLRQTLDPSGLPEVSEYFLGYDANAKNFFDPVVVVTSSYNFDGPKMTAKSEQIDWLDITGNVVLTRIFRSEYK